MRLAHLGRGSDRDVEDFSIAPFDPEACRRDIAAMNEQVDAASKICTATIGELRRQHQAMTKRRGRGRSADAGNYALGASLVLVGLGGVDETALVGLMAHPDQMLRWIQHARGAGAGPMFGDLVKVVFASEPCFAWCRQWGRVLQWRRRKELYDASVTRFIVSGKASLNRRWRRETVTDDQAALVLTLVEILSEPMPNLETRGEAFDWIFGRGGNPAYWNEPTLPPALEIHHG